MIFDLPLPISKTSSVHIINDQITIKSPALAHVKGDLSNGKVTGHQLARKRTLGQLRKGLKFQDFRIKAVT